jgi:hypothetical protein
MQKAVHIHNTLLARLAAPFSERQLLAFARTLDGQTDAFLTLVWRHFPQDSNAVQAALDLVLARKAIAYEAAAAQQHATLSGAYPALQEPFAQLSRVRAELARRALSGPAQGETVVQYEERLRVLEHDREELERHLAAQVPEIELQRRLHAADRAAIARALPARTLTNSVEPQAAR